MIVLSLWGNSRRKSSKTVQFRELSQLYQRLNPIFFLSHSFFLSKLAVWGRRRCRSALWLVDEISWEIPFSFEISMLLQSFVSLLRLMSVWSSKSKIKQKSQNIFTFRLFTERGHNWSLDQIASIPFWPNSDIARISMFFLKKKDLLHLILFNKKN